DLQRQVVARQLRVAQQQVEQVQVDEEVLPELVLGPDAALLEEVAQVRERLPLRGGHVAHGFCCWASRHFQTYFARMSVSRFTVSRGRLRPSVGWSGVWGIGATLKPPAVTSTSVRLTPSTATDPLGTICAASSAGHENHTPSHGPSGTRRSMR